jgi:hypothetical protein
LLFAYIWTARTPDICNPVYRAGTINLATRCYSKIFSSLTHTCGTDDIRCLIVNGSGITETHALRVAIAQITFENAAPPGIPSHGTKRAGCYAHFAANTEVMVDSDTLKRVVAVDGIFGTDFQTGGVFTLLAAHGHINPDVFPFNNLDARQRGIADPIMTDRTNEFAVSATGALFRIYCQ